MPQGFVSFERETPYELVEMSSGWFVINPVPYRVMAVYGSKEEAEWMRGVKTDQFYRVTDPVNLGYEVVWGSAPTPKKLIQAQNHIHSRYPDTFADYQAYRRKGHPFV